MQTIASVFLYRPVVPSTSARHLVETTQGDYISVHSDQPSPARHESPARQVVLMHGLAGSQDSGYLLQTGLRLLDSGCGVWRMNSRGSGTGKRHARYHNHAGRSEDYQAVVEYVAGQHPVSKITVVGFSLGGAVMLNWLSSQEITRNRACDSAIAVAPPVDLARCTRGLKAGFSRVYDRYFASVMLKRRADRKRIRPDMIDCAFGSTPQSLDAFDRAFTVPVGGFQDLDQYYKLASSHERIKLIDIPTTIVVDQLDPVVPIDLFQGLQTGPMVDIVQTRGGGHLGYIAKLGIDSDRFWMTWRIRDAIVAINNSEART